MTEAQKPSSFNERQHAHLSALLEEYRALYGLVLFRLTALDRRVPVANAALLAFATSAGALPIEGRWLVLLGVPIGASWLLRVTVNHARSLEDALRHIEAVERRINALLALSAVSFQGEHPSRGRAVGGRTGQESIRAVLAGSLLMIGQCAYLAWFGGVMPQKAMLFYGAYIAGVLLDLCSCSVRLLRYHYEPRSVVAPRV